MDYAALNRELLPNLDCLLAVWLPDGRKAGKEYLARNPLRLDQNTGSFCINRFTGRWSDFATHDRGGDIISLYAYLNQISQSEAARRLSSPQDYRKITVSPYAPPKPPKAPNAKAVAAILRTCQPAAGTLVESYLRARAIPGAIPHSLFYHPSLLHAPSSTRWPAMVAAVMRWPGDVLVALHRTYLAHDGSGKAPVTPNKMMLGSVAGGAVRFGDALETIIVAEGIETALSLYHATGITTWAALSTSGIRGLILPPPATTPHIILAADHDTAGITAAQEAAEKWQRLGHLVKVAIPPAPGMDFNDVLRAS